MANEALSVEVRMGQGELAKELAAWLTGEGVQDVGVTRERGIVDGGLGFVLLGLFTVRELAKLWVWLRDHTQCRTVYDFRQEIVQSTVDCRFHDGKILIVAPDGKLTIHEQTKIEKPEKLLETVAKQGVHDALGAVGADNASLETL